MFSKHRQYQTTLLVLLIVLELQQLSHLEVVRGDFVVKEAVRVLFFWTVQLLPVLIDMLQHPAAVGGRQLEPHLWS